jgi:valyl-tRNA synthetase
VRQDPDVLDTWFSSALLPLTVNGWPERDLRYTTDPYFPLSLMETGHDIIFFWVSRMVVLSLALTDRLPFRRVLLHGMVCDGNGKKMSKTRGNAIDPLDMIDGISLSDLKAKTRRHLESGLLSHKELDVALRQLSGRFPNGVVSCGADALRYSLLELEFKAENVAFDGHRVFKNRNFCNKMYQTVRYLAQHVDSGFTVDRDVLAVSVIDSHYEVSHLI